MTRYDEVQLIANAIQRNEPTYKGITLLTPQTSGTSMQKRTYAVIKAEEIYELI